MKKIFFLFIFIYTYSFSQEFYIFDKDTLNYNYRSGSYKIDSLDFYHTSSTTLNAGGSMFHPFGLYQQTYTNFLPLLDNSFVPFKELKIKYTVLPHLGFIYSTGSSGIQFMHTDFQFLLNKKTLLNFNFDVNSLGKLLRNGNFRNSYIDLLILHKSNRISNDLVFRYYQCKMSLNSGLLDTTLVNTNQYALLQVQNENSNSILKNVSLSNQLSLNFIKDSSAFVGLTYLSEWQLRQREYKETGDLSSIYSNIYIDSFNTRDQYQVASISNGLGFRFFKNSFQSELLAKHKYWDLQNLAKHHDTNEIYLDFNIKYKKNKLSYLSLVEANIFGALGQMNVKQKVEWQNKSIKIGLNYLFRQFYPLAEQRYYYSNNFSWQNTKFNLQTINQLTLSSRFIKNNFELFSNISWSYLNNKYFYDGAKFINDTLNNLSFFSFSIKSSIKLSNFEIQPFISLNIFPSNFSYAPLYDSRIRFFFNKKMFKSKKLDFLMGFDVSYIASHQLFIYQRTLGIYTINNNNSKSNEYIGLDFFTGFELSVFRFYLKVEKIDYLWSKRNQWEISKVPISPMLFRLGLTWDFFN